jgi:ABC-type oligopeptide transport system substrate-binding subunit
MAYQFYVNAWRALGLDVRIKATNYNQFQEKVRNGAYQIFIWGWMADYPDPENFLFLLYSKMARTKNNGPNSANFENKNFDELFLDMRSRNNDDTRYRICRKMINILENECPWIPLVHNEDYGLYHAWYKNVKPGGLSSPKFKYLDIDPAMRDAYQKKHNKPIMWPLYVGILIFFAASIPAVITFYRERQ